MMAKCQVIIRGTRWEEVFYPKKLCAKHAKELREIYKKLDANIKSIGIETTP